MRSHIKLKWLIFLDYQQCNPLKLFSENNFNQRSGRENSFGYHDHHLYCTLLGADFYHISLCDFGSEIHYCGNETVLLILKPYCQNARL